MSFLFSLPVERGPENLKFIVLSNPVDLNDIIFVHPANGWKEEDGRAVGCIGAASWGMGNTGIFWSRDFSRYAPRSSVLPPTTPPYPQESSNEISPRNTTICRVKYCLYANQESLQNSIVLKRKGGWGRIGFTVDDMEKFWEALERVRPGSIEG